MKSWMNKFEHSKKKIQTILAATLLLLALAVMIKPAFAVGTNAVVSGDVYGNVSGTVYGNDNKQGIAQGNNTLTVNTTRSVTSMVYATPLTPPPGSISAIPTSVTFLFDTADKEGLKARFNWVTSDMEINTSVLNYAKKEGFNGTFTNTIIGEAAPIDQRDLYEMFTGQYKNEVQLTPVISHRAASGVLEPDTEYVYSVGDGGANVIDTANPPSFKTPAANVDQFSFLWITDPQESGVDVETVYGKYDKYMGRAVREAFTNPKHPSIDFILSTGDNVDFGFDTKEWDAYYNAMQPYLYSTPYYSSTGNHEYEGNPGITGSWDSIDPYMVTAKGRINVPKNGPAYRGAGTDGLKPSVTGAIKQRLDGNTYYYEYGDAIFFVLDYSPDTSNVDETGDKGYSLNSDKAIKAELDWMKSVLKTNDKKWKFVAMHQSPYNGRFAQPQYWRTVTDAFDECGIDVVISGHDHLYLRSKLMNNNQVATIPGTGTTYITGATAGNQFGTLYGQFNPVTGTYTEKYTDWVVSGYHIIDVNATGISITSEGIKMLPKDGVTKQEEGRESDFKEDENGFRNLDVSSKVVITNTPRAKNLGSWEYPNPPVEQSEVDAYLPPVVNGWYEVSKPSQLLRLSQKMANRGGNVPMNAKIKLMNDIDMKGITGYLPLGDNRGSAGYFSGIFDGNGKSIRNLSLTYSDTWKVDGNSVYTGLISYMNDATIKNVNLVDSNLNGSNGYYAGLVAVMSGASSIEGSSVSGEISGWQGVGAIAGRMSGTSKIANSYSVAKITGSSLVGGLVGTSETSGGDVRIENSLALGAVKAKNGIAGGIIGNISNGSITTITNSVAYNRSVDATTGAGQFFGANASGTLTNNFYAANMALTGTVVSQAGVGTATAVQLADKNFYETTLAWNFIKDWKWTVVKTAGYPLPFNSSLGLPPGLELTPAHWELDLSGVNVGNMPANWKNQQLSHVSAIDDSGTKVIQAKDSRSMPYDTYFDFPEPIYGTNITFKYKIFVKDYGNTQNAYGPILYIKDNEGKSAMEHSIVMWGVPYYDYGKGDIGGLQQGLWYDMELEIDPAAGKFHWTLNGADWDSYLLKNKVNNISRIGIRSNQMDENSIVYFKDLVVETTGYTGGGEEPDPDPVDTTALNAALTTASQLLVNHAEGSGVGQAPASARTALQKAIAEAQAIVYDAANQTQAQLDAATAALQTAISTFKSLVVTTAVDVWTLGSLDRAKKTSAAGIQKAAEVYAGKGETTSFQIVVKAADNKTLDISDLKISNLTGPNGNVINSANVDLYREHFIKVGTRTQGGQGGTNNRLPDEWYPDALIPFIDPVTGAAPTAGALYKAIPYTVAAGENMPFWVDINVPADTAPGIYSGTYTVHTAAGEISGEISLNVWNFTVPVKSNLYTSFGIRGDGNSNPGDYVTNHNYKNDVNVHKELLRNRINPESGVNPKDEDELIAMGLQALNTGFWGNTSYGDTTMDPPPTVDEIAAEAAKHDSRLLLYNYTADEIEFVYDQPKYHDTFRNTMKAWADNLHQAGVKQLVVTKPYDDLLTDDDYPGGAGKPIVDIYAILNTYYGDSEEVVKRALDKGAMVWTYAAMSQDDYSPKWAIDYAPINYRINQGFINQSIGVNGLLYWTVNYWSSSPWASVNAEASSVETPGEGILIYPGEQAGLKGVAPSIRLKNIRDGIYDFDYIEMLKQAGYGEWALNISKGIAADFKNWNQSPDALGSARIMLGNKLSEIQQSQPSSNADLSDLKVDGVTVVGFNAKKLDYTVNVANSINSVVVSASAADQKASVEIAGGNVLAIGENTVSVTVTAEDRVTKKEYKITVTRTAAQGGDGDSQPSSNADLSDLKVDGVTVAGFNANKLDYTVNVGNSINSVAVSASATDQKASVEIVGGSVLAVGENTVSVTVTAEDGVTKKEYKITVTRAAAQGGDGDSNGNGNIGGGGRTRGGGSAPANSGTIVAASGGTLTLNGAKIDVPVGATADNIQISVVRVSDTSILPADEALKLLSDVYEIKKDTEGEFSKPIVITLPFDKTKVDLNRSMVGLYWLNEQTNKWEQLDSLQVDPDQATVSGSVQHFTKFAVLATDKTGTATESAKPQTNDVDFADIKGHWAAASVRDLVKLGAINGYPDKTFKPNNNITRAEFVTVIVKAFHLKSEDGKNFADASSHWAKSAIATAASLGVVNGYSEKAFGPDDLITREQMAAIVIRAAQIDSADKNISFSDSETVSDWARTAIAAAAAKGLINGYEDGTVKSKANSTRAEAVTVILRALELKK
ncbi:S-layer homology domain-containing protein [Paenibacillus piri]|uniref:DUF4091 domain-containing protein n=1 Tax=Paenibacillus piri TaxID=2547395 RepID=A0A4V2ZTV8_9BACL|nr:S-layer homology domain-containing protein [Paenibacillus piri]TDF98654.1 DUF4091 domain-containing protein [Paenibacillus piri]